MVIEKEKHLQELLEAVIQRSERKGLVKENFYLLLKELISSKHVRKKMLIKGPVVNKPCKIIILDVLFKILESVYFDAYISNRVPTAGSI